MFFYILIWAYKDIYELHKNISLPHSDFTADKVKSARSPPRVWAFLRLKIIFIDCSKHNLVNNSASIVFTKPRYKLVF